MQAGKSCTGLTVQELFKRVPLFTDLSEPALNMLILRSESASAPPGGLVVREGESNSHFFLTCAGSLRVYRQFGLPDQTELATLGPGDFFGEMCILEIVPRSATVQAVTQATFLTLRPTDFYILQEQMPDQYGVLLLNIARDLARRLRKLNDNYVAKH